MGLAGGFVGIVLGYFNYKPGVEKSSEALLGICLMMTIIPAVLNLITGLLMKKYIINDEYCVEMKKALSR